MKTLKVLCVVDKVNPKLEYKNLVALKERGNIRLLKGEKIILCELKVV